MHLAACHLQLEYVFVVIASPGPWAQLVPMDLPAVRMHPHWTDITVALTIAALAYLGYQQAC